MNPLLGGLMQQGLNFGLGILQDRYQDKRQLKQNAALMQQSIEGQKEMGLFNQGLQMQMLRENQSWNSPKAMLARIKEAGLSPALMYGGTGAGISGTSGQAGQAGGAQGGSPLMGRSQEVDILKLQAELDLIEAQKRNLDADSSVKENTGEDEAEARIEKLQADKRYQDLQSEFQSLRNDIQEMTKYIEVDKLNNELNNLIADYNLKLLETEYQEMTLDDKVAMVYEDYLGVQLENDFKRRNIDKTEAEINKISEDIAAMWTNIGLTESAQELQSRDLDRKDKELAETKHANNIKAYEAQIKEKYPAVWEVVGNNLEWFKRLDDNTWTVAPKREE